MWTQCSLFYRLDDKHSLIVCHCESCKLMNKTVLSANLECLDFNQVNDYINKFFKITMKILIVHSSSGFTSEQRLNLLVCLTGKKVQFCGSETLTYIAGPMYQIFVPRYALSGNNR